VVSEGRGGDGGRRDDWVVEGMRAGGGDLMCQQMTKKERKRNSTPTPPEKELPNVRGHDPRQSLPQRIFASCCLCLWTCGEAKGLLQRTRLAHLECAPPCPVHSDAANLPHATAPHAGVDGLGPKSTPAADPNASPRSSSLAALSDRQPNPF